MIYTSGFEYDKGLIKVGATIVSSLGEIVPLKFFLDTGANGTSIDEKFITRNLGYDLSKGQTYTANVAGGKTFKTTELPVKAFSALGLERKNYMVATDNFERYDVHGLLGIDFFYEHILTLDLVNQRILLGKESEYHQYMTSLYKT